MTPKMFNLLKAKAAQKSTIIGVVLLLGLYNVPPERVDQFARIAASVMGLLAIVYNEKPTREEAAEDAK